MRIVVKRPGEEPEPFDTPGELPDLQALVGGYIEAYRLGHLWLFYDEDGKSKGYPLNLMSPNLGPIVGAVFVSKANDEGDNIDLTPEDEEYAKRELRAIAV